MAKLPSYRALWDAYPDYIFYTTPQVKKLIGGRVDASWITNSCALRLSRTLNYNSLELPRRHSKMNVVSGSDKKWYAYRVREIRPWLIHNLGSPPFDLKKKEGESFDKKSIASKKGIIGFDIRFDDATGHLDLWDGARFTSEHLTTKDYWLSATRIWIWTTP